MNQSLYDIAYIDLLWISLPILAVLAVYLHWSLGIGEAVYALSRMVLQLIVIGYALSSIFAAESPAVISGILGIMLVAAGIIALRPVRSKRKSLYFKALFSIASGGLITLVLVIQGVVHLDPWYRPRYLIPLASMIFANSMNAVSIAAERFEVEMDRESTFAQARTTAFHAALIPVVNSLFAVGLVSLPGMMTGQILSGISPLIAARYQIMVMCMIFGSAGISCALYLTLARRDYPS